LIFKITRRRRGREAVIVYIIMYIPACVRSGWYPHPRMRIRVGIRDISKKMYNHNELFIRNVRRRAKFRIQTHQENSLIRLAFVLMEF